MSKMPEVTKGEANHMASLVFPTESREYYARHHLAWKLDQYKTAYLTDPKEEWPLYEFAYRCILRTLVEELNRRMFRDLRKPMEIVKDLEGRFDKASEEPNCEIYSLFKDAANELGELVAYFQGGDE